MSPCNFSQHNFCPWTAPGLAHYHLFLPIPFQPPVLLISLKELLDCSGVLTTLCIGELWTAHKPSLPFIYILPCRSPRSKLVPCFTYRGLQISHSPHVLSRLWTGELSDCSKVPCPLTVDYITSLEVLDWRTFRLLQSSPVLSLQIYHKPLDYSRASPHVLPGVVSLCFPDCYKNPLLRINPCLCYLDG